MSLLNAWFNAFLRSRRAGNLFGRRAMPEAGYGRGSTQAAPATLTAGLLALAQGSDADALATLQSHVCLLYTSPSPRDLSTSRMPSSA